MTMRVSQWAPLEERQRLLSEEIVREAVAAYRQANDVFHAKRLMQAQYNEIVTKTDQWWLTEQVYAWIVEYTFRSLGSNGNGQV